MIQPAVQQLEGDGIEPVVHDGVAPAANAASVG
jgi:hypothetical protein